MLSDTKDLLYVALTVALHRLRDSTPGNAICEHEARLMFDNVIKLKAPRPFFLSGKFERRNWRHEQQINIRDHHTPQQHAILSISDSMTIDWT